MNIFVLNDNPIQAAQEHSDKLVNKMLIESCQLMSYTHILMGSAMLGHVYRRNKGHLKHPCTFWLQESRANYIWCYEFTCELYAEFRRRYGKTHLTGEETLPALETIPPGYTSNSRTRFALSMPEEFKQDNAVNAYQNYYASKWYIPDDYNRAPMPEWLATKLGFF